MTAQLERRLLALEACNEGKTPPGLFIVTFVKPGHLDAEQIGIRASPPHFPDPVDRRPDETWDEFILRLQGKIAHLPSGSMVPVISRQATS